MSSIAKETGIVAEGVASSLHVGFGHEWGRCEIASVDHLLSKYFCNIFGKPSSLKEYVEFKTLSSDDKEAKLEILKVFAFKGDLTIGPTGYGRLPRWCEKSVASEIKEGIFYKIEVVEITTSDYHRKGSFIVFEDKQGLVLATSHRVSYGENKRENVNDMRNKPDKCCCGGEECQ